MGNNIATQSVEIEGNEYEADADSDGDARTGKVFVKGVAVK